jgi:hypothetical protein
VAGFVFKVAVSCMWCVPPAHVQCALMGKVLSTHVGRPCTSASRSSGLIWTEANCKSSCILLLASTTHVYMCAYIGSTVVHGLCYPDRPTLV